MLKNIPLTLSFVLLLGSPAMAQWGESSLVLLKNGNTLIEYNRRDTFEIIDPVTDETTWKFNTSKYFAKLNEAPLYKHTQVKKPARKWLGGDILKVLDRKLRNDIADAKNFFGQIELIIDKDGNIAYSNITLHDTAMFGTSSARVNKALSESIKYGIMQKLNKMHFKPAMKDGQPVAYYAVFY